MRSSAPLRSLAAARRLGGADAAGDGVVLALCRSVLLPRLVSHASRLHGLGARRGPRSVATLGAPFGGLVGEPSGAGLACARARLVGQSHCGLLNLSIRC